jgi:hypothetical protein
MRRRSIRTRSDARFVAHHAVGDAEALWLAVRHENHRSPIRSDEIRPIHTLRRSARKVAELLKRRGDNHRKNA